MEAADSARHRAKVYCLNANGNWDDRGTGHAAVQYSPVCDVCPPQPPAPYNDCSATASAAGLPPTRGTRLMWAAALDSQAEQAAFVVVISEDEGHQTLLQARVHMEDIYQRQQGVRPLAQSGSPAELGEHTSLAEMRMRRLGPSSEEAPGSVRRCVCISWKSASLICPIYS